MGLPVSTFVVLGLVAKRPGSGYDVSAFAEHTVRHFWPISRSQLYSELARLEQLGWVSGTAVEQDRYPNKRVYETTPAGLAALREWLDETPAQPRQGIRDAVVLKTFLGAFMSPERLAEHLRACRDHAERVHAELSRTVGHLDSAEQTASRRLGRASARYGVLQAEATMAWVDEVQPLLQTARRPETG